jgi:ubiquinone/menaquinone biosynthesis C-methylase UbiE
MSWWDAAYGGSPPWDIVAPQPEIVGLADRNEILGKKVLDIGCGLGYNAIFLSRRGYLVTCLDIASTAIEKARENARNEKAEVKFIVGDALRMETYFGTKYFETVVDSGLFHSFPEEDRPVYADQVWKVLINGGKCFVLCFSDKETGAGGPRRISKKELGETFAGPFKINYIREGTFANRFFGGGARAYLASMTKVEE